MCKNEETVLIIPSPKKTRFNQAPLPFIGQKRMFLKQFETILDENIEGMGEGWTIVDAFGGSGLLAHIAKHKKPLARVIYNDFDGYSQRLKHIKDTNQLRQQLFQIVDGIIPKNKRIDKQLKQEIINKINQFNGFKDLNCLSSWLLFSCQQVSSFEALCGRTFYHCIRQTDYPEAADYLYGIEVVQESFHTLLPKFQQDSKTLFVLDPPYLCTRQESYKQATYFDLIDFLRLIHLTRPPYIFFSSTKSEFVRFIEYMQEVKMDNWQSFDGVQRKAIKAALNYQVQYEDNLIYKF